MHRHRYTHDSRVPSAKRQVRLFGKSAIKTSPNENEYIDGGAAGVAVDRGTVCNGRCLICSYYLISEMKYDIGGDWCAPSSTIKVLFMTKPDTIRQPHLIFVSVLESLFIYHSPRRTKHAFRTCFLLRSTNSTHIRIPTSELGRQIRQKSFDDELFYISMFVSSLSME